MVDDVNNKAYNVKDFTKEELAFLADRDNFVRDESPESVAKAYHKAKSDGSNPELVKAVEDVLNTQLSPTRNPFEAFEQKGEAGRKARAELKNKVGSDEFKRLEAIHKNKEKILKGLEKNGTLKIECP